MADLGVLVGIGFLIVEVEQNTRAQNGATMQAFVSAAAENNEVLSTSADLMAIVARGDCEGIGALDDVERRRYLQLAVQVFQNWEVLCLQTLDGTIDESCWVSKRRGLILMVETNFLKAA